MSFLCSSQPRVTETICCLNATLQVTSFWHHILKIFHYQTGSISKKMNAQYSSLLCIVGGQPLHVLCVKSLVRMSKTLIFSLFLLSSSKYRVVCAMYMATNNNAPVACFYNIGKKNMWSEARRWSSHEGQWEALISQNLWRLNCCISKPLARAAPKFWFNEKRICKWLLELLFIW